MAKEEVEITISGIEEVCEGLTTAPSRIVKHGFAKALTAAAVPIVEALEARTPIETGDLKKHVMTEITVNADSTGGRSKVGFGRFGYIARFVEFGHRSIAHKNGKDSKAVLGEVQAHPFMRPAASTSAESAIEAFSESLGDSLRDDI
jgi:HK97 gp10 family phage protein